MDLGLKDRRALVTAASRGLGRACAEALEMEGAKVFISSRDATAIEKTGTAIRPAGWAAADVSKPGEPETLVEQARTRLGVLGILAVNAAGPPPGPFQVTPLESGEEAFQLTSMRRS